MKGYIRRRFPSITIVRSLAEFTPTVPSGLGMRKPLFIMSTIMSTIVNKIIFYINNGVGDNNRLFATCSIIPVISFLVSEDRPLSIA